MQRRFLFVIPLVLAVAGWLYLLRDSRDAGRTPAGVATAGPATDASFDPATPTAIPEPVDAPEAPAQASAKSRDDPDAWASLTAAADAMPRFDVAEWPPLPADDAPLAEVFDVLLARAGSGDAGAACWLAEQLSRCRLRLDIDAKLTRQNALQRERATTDAARAEIFARESERVASVAQCHALTQAHWGHETTLARQAALAGSWRAIQRTGIGLMPPGAEFPRADDLRQHLDDREAMMWAALRAGSRGAHDELWTAAHPMAWLNTRSPNVPALSATDRDALLVLHGFLAARGFAGADPGSGGRGRHVVPPGDTESLPVPQWQRARLGRLADRLVQESMEPGHREKAERANGDSVQAGCAVFGAPVDRAISLKRILGS